MLLWSYHLDLDGVLQNIYLSIFWVFNVINQLITDKNMLKDCSTLSKFISHIRQRFASLAA